MKSVGIDDPLLERDIWKLTKLYLKTDAFMDITANIPGLVYTIMLDEKAQDAELTHLFDDKIFLAFMSFKILRLAHVDEVQDAFTRLFDKLGDVFYLKRYMFENVLSWFLTGFKFLLSIHYLACGWVLINVLKGIHGVKRVEFAGQTVAYRYFESFYMISTTITTVGYGDYKAFNDSDDVWMAEMIFLFCVALLGTLLFTTVTNSVFNY